MRRAGEQGVTAVGIKRILHRRWRRLHCEVSTGRYRTVPYSRRYRPNVPTGNMGSFLLFGHKGHPFRAATGTEIAVSHKLVTAIRAELASAAATDLGALRGSPRAAGSGQQ